MKKHLFADQHCVLALTGLIHFVASLILLTSVRNKNTIPYLFQVLVVRSETGMKVCTTVYPAHGTLGPLPLSGAKEKTATSCILNQVPFPLN